MDEYSDSMIENTNTCGGDIPQEEKNAFLEAHNIPVTTDDNSQTNEEHVLGKTGICELLRKNPSYRKRFIHSLCLFLSSVSQGLNLGLIGPTLPDIRLIVDADLDTASWLFTAFSIGFLVGSLMGGVLYDRFDKLLLLFFSMLCLALTGGILPWCEQFSVMVTIRAFSGMAAGGLETGTNTDMVSIWDEEGRSYMQALHFCFGIGGFISPLLAEPFLAQKYCTLRNDTYRTLGRSFSVSVNSTLPVTEDNVYLAKNIYFSNDQGSNSTNVTECIYAYEKTRVQYAYLIVSFIILFSAFPYLLMYVKQRREMKPHTVYSQASRTNNKVRPIKLTLKLKLVLLILLSAMMMTYNAIEDTFSGFLMTFTIEHLRWDKQTGSFASSLFWIAFTGARFLGIFLVRFVRPARLLLAFLIMLICSFICFLFGSISFVLLVIWFSVPLIGFSMSIIFPCIFTWTEESILQVTGKVSAMFLISSSGGLLINPLVLGHLMKSYAPIWFAYLFLAQSIAVFGLFLIILFIVKTHRQPVAHSVNDK